MSSTTAIERELTELKAGIDELKAAIAQRFFGQRDVVELLLYALLARGHVLLEGAPGLGKTTLAKSLAASLDLRFGRIQCTPDLMPADVLGTRILEEDEHGKRRFTFARGPVFCHVLLADEINRATPRTQSALLEAMQERQVTIFGEAFALEEPFCVIATQNPIEMEGTYPLPEAQIDRFLLKVNIATPALGEMVAMLESTTGRASAATKPVMSREKLVRLQALVRDVPASSDMIALAARLVLATHAGEPSAPDRVHRYVRYGSSPRGAQSLVLAAKARALVEGRLFVSEDDLERLAVPALRHRLILNYEGEAALTSTDELVVESFARAKVGR
jgi:MoxR-like ATPase